jgi:hypothetical protein
LDYGFVGDDFSLVHYVAVLNVFVGAASFCSFKNIQDKHTLNQRKILEEKT